MLLVYIQVLCQKKNQFIQGLKLVILSHQVWTMISFKIQ